MKTKTMKITGILLTFVMLVTMFGAFSLTASAADGDACVSTADCTGTYANGFCTVCDGYEPATPVTQDNYAELGLAESYIGYYAIGNAGQLYWFADKVDNENATYGSVNVVLTADVTVNEGTVTASSTGMRDWNPIGWFSNTSDDRAAFSGTFDGNGKSISGLYFNNIAIYGVSLFAITGETALVKNVTVTNSYFCGDYNNSAVVAINLGTVSGCFNKATISGDGQTGGIVGRNLGLVELCGNTGAITGGMTSTGGIVGDNKSTVRNCWNTGNIQADYNYVGGITGANNCSDGAVALTENCWSTGTVVSYGRNTAGGIVGAGWWNRGGVRNCYSLMKPVGGTWNGHPVTNVETKTAEQFASGEVAYLLGAAWGQTLGANGDAYPVFATDTNKVYMYKTGLCTAIEYKYTNVETADSLTHDAGDTAAERFDSSTGACSACGELMAVASLTTADATPVVTYYMTLENAITAAESAENSTVTLLDNTKLSDYLDITNGKFTIDLNGKTLGSGYQISLYDCDVTIMDDSELPGGLDTYIYSWSSGASLTVNGGKYESVLNYLGNVKIIDGTFKYINVDEDYEGVFGDAIAKGSHVYDENGNVVDVNNVQISGHYYRVMNVSVKQGADISKDAVITVSNAVYNGTAQPPTVIVTVGGVTLEYGVDYTISVEGNAETMNAGTYNITITGLGNYTGSVGNNFTIEKAEPGLGVDASYLNKTYNLQKHTVTVELPAGLDERYVTISYWKNGSLIDAPIDAGTYKVFVSVKDSPNYKDEVREYDMTISPADVTVEIMEINPKFFYTGGAHTPAVIVTLNGGLPFDPTEYGGIVDYTNNIEVGTATATVSGNFTGSCTFEIKKATPTITVSAPLDKVMPGYVMDITGATDAIDNFLYPTTFTVVDGEGYSVSGNTITIDEGVKIGSTITVKMVSTETKNFVAGEGTLTLTIGVPTVDTVEIEKNIAELEKAINDLKTEHGADVTELETELAALKQQISDVNSDIAQIQIDISNLKADVAEIETLYATKAELNTAVSELTTLINSKADASALTDAIENINKILGTIPAGTDIGTELASLDAAIDTLNADVATNASGISENKNAILTLATTVNTLKNNLEAKDAELAGKLTTLEENLAKLEERVAANEADIDKLQSDLAAAIEDLNKAIENGDKELSDKIEALTKALADAEAALKQADADNKAELVKKIEDADKALDDAIKAVQTNLDNAKEELQKAIDANEADIEEKVANLNTALADAKAVLEQADADNKAELVKKIEDADATLDAAIKAVQKNLDDAKAELNKAIADGDTALDGKISNLNAALESAKAALEATDAANKTELEGKITSAQTSLQAAIDQVQTNLDSAKAELDKAIADLDAAMKQGDADLSTEIANLNTALMNAKAALEKADADNKAELVSKIETADATLDAAIKAVQKNLDDAKAELNKAIADGDTALDGKIAALNTSLTEAVKALEAADAANKSELEGKITEAQTTLQSAIDKVAKDLADAEKELADAIASGDAALSSRISSVSASLSAAKTALEKADADNKAELIAKIEAAEATLDAAIKAVQKNLDDAKAELNKAIADGDTALDGKIAALNTSLTEAVKALEAADAADKAELTAKLDEAHASLDAAIKAVQKNLDDAKAALEKADKDNKAALEKADADNKAALEAKDLELDANDSKLTETINDLKTFIIVVCVIASVALAGCGAFVIWFFIDRKKI